MSGWYWLLWALVSCFNVAVLLRTRSNLRATRLLLEDHFPGLRNEADR